MTDLISAVSYRRVSTEDQADFGFSLIKQLQRNTTYAQDNNLNIIADFAEDISGAVPIEDRPEGRKMLDALQQRRALALVCHEADRLSRDIVNLLATVQRLLRDGIQIHIADVGHVKSELDISLIIKGWQASSERVRISERMMRGKRAKAESGKWIGGTPPLGYRSQGSNRDAHMVIYEPEAEIVRSIYRWYTVERLPMLAIADRLNRAGIRTQRGTWWWKAIIKKILSNETYIGVAYYAGIRIDLPELAIIDAATFERAQELKQLNRERASRNRKYDYLLSNHLHCACGATMTGSTLPNNQRTYYRCSQFQWPATRRDCPLGAPHASGFVLDHLVWSYVAQLIDDDDLLTSCIVALNAARQSSDSDGAAEVERCDRTIAAAQRRIDRLLREFGDDPDEDVARATKAAIRDAQRERDEARVKRGMLLNVQHETERAEAGQGRILEQVRIWRGLIGQADFQFQRDVLDALDVRVVLLNDEAGGRVVEVGTALSLPMRFAYMGARRYKRMLWGEKP